MTDPVSELLDERLRIPWHWRSAIGVAVGIHLAAALALLVPHHVPRRAVSLPHVTVRLAAAPALPAARPPATSARPERPPARPAAKTATRPAEPKPVKQPVKAERSTRRTEPEHAPPDQPAAVPDAGTSSPGGPPEGSQSGSSASGVNLGLAGSPGGTDEPFPYDYYLQRVLGTIEANWFRPQVPAATRARILCRVDRSGRLIEAGVEESSGVPAFDRAALRAVYAAAPLPPLPQAYAGPALTLHLEFTGQ